jgi:hypothetical protein
VLVHRRGRLNVARSVLSLMPTGSNDLAAPFDSYGTITLQDCVVRNDGEHKRTHHWKPRLTVLDLDRVASHYEGPRFSKCLISITMLSA